jgi:RNA polymerase sigma-70 factor (ECF subfamily)
MTAILARKNTDVLGSALFGESSDLAADLQVAVWPLGIEDCHCHLRAAAVDARDAEESHGNNQQLQCIRREEDFKLLEALQELPPASRTVLLLHYFQGLSYQEIGETLGLPVSTVKIRIFRAKKILLEKWHELGNEGQGPFQEGE